MQVVSCALRSTVNELCADRRTLTLRTKTAYVAVYTMYEVYVVKSMATTFFGGLEWNRLLVEHKLKQGDQVLLRNHKATGLLLSVCYRAAHHCKVPKSNLICLYSSYPPITVFQVIVLNHYVCYCR